MNPLQSSENATHERVTYCYGFVKYHFGVTAQV